MTKALSLNPRECYSVPQNPSSKGTLSPYDSVLARGLGFRVLEALNMKRARILLGDLGYIIMPEHSLMPGSCKVFEGTSVQGTSPRPGSRQGVRSKFGFRV